LTFGRIYYIVYYVTRNPFARAEVRWNEWNVDHCAKHGLEPWEVEYIIRHPERYYPKRMGNKYLIRGRLPGGGKVQVVVVRDKTDWMQVYPIHAMPL
jgi:hypothetical protein